MKIGVCSDEHVGRAIPREIGDLRRQAYRSAFSQAIDMFIKERVDVMISAGDLFERRTMTAEDTAFVRAELQRLVDALGKVDIFFIRGNHDSSYANNALHFIQHPLAKYVHVLEDEGYSSGGISVFGVSYDPYISTKFQRLRPAIKKFFADNDAPIRVVITHTFIDGYTSLPPNLPRHYYLTINDFADVGCNIVVNGHVHSSPGPKTFDKILFLTPGATEPEDLGEDGPYGVYVIEGSAKFIPIDPFTPILNVEVKVDGALGEKYDWFVSNVERKVAERMKGANKPTIIRVKVEGVVNGEPGDLTSMLYEKISDLRDKDKNLAYVALVNKTSGVSKNVVFSPSGVAVNRDDYLDAVFEGLPESVRKEALVLANDIDIALDQQKSQQTGVLTASDRKPFVRRWQALFEEGAKP
jgi:DNA repair exonuclease SbcCD nuclease subunit